MAGNFNPTPERFGASFGTNLEAMLNDLLQGLGSGFKTEYGSVTWIYMNAIARVFNDVFEQNKRLANQWDPLRMTDFLSRWEKILGLMPLESDTLVERRQKVESKLETLGKAGTQQVIYDLLTAILGADVFVSIVNNNSNTANVYVPGGATIGGGATIPDGDWYSTVSYLPIKVVQPAYMDDLTFYDTVNQIYTYLEAIVPAWVTYAWYKDSPTYGVGFYLDEINLDTEAFS